MNADATTSEPQAAGRVTWLARWWAAGLLLLMAATWPLWLPAVAPPSVPAAAFLRRLPGELDWLLVAAVACGAVGVLSGWRRGGLRCGVAALAGLLLLDQLRWQPWSYHLLLAGAVLLLAHAALAVRLLRWLAVSVYVYSAIAKLDYAFATTIGRQMIDATLGRVIAVDSLPPATVMTIAIAMPLAELAIGPLLFFPRTRNGGLALATLMHLGATVALGPLGLGHWPGVVLWNLVFLAHVWLLFGPPVAAAAAPVPSDGRRDRLAWMIVLLAVIGPLTRQLGVWDRWPSWGLYAPGGQRTEVRVHRSVVDRLPAGLPVDPRDAEADWRRVQLDEWSLNESYAPLYPQRRTIIALALALHDRGRLGDFMRVDQLSAADRFTGERDSDTLLGAKAINQQAGRYWLNAKAVRWD